MKLEESTESRDVYKHYKHIFSALSNELENDLKSIKENQVVFQEHESELKNLHKLRNDILCNELDTNAIDLKIVAKEVELQKITTRRKELTEKIERLKQQEIVHEPTQWLLNYAKDILSYERIQIIEGIWQLFDFAKVEIATADGIPLYIKVSFSYPKYNSNLIELNKIALTNADQKVVRGWVPEEVRWIPNEWLTTKTPPTINYHLSTCIISQSDEEKSKNLNLVYFDETKKQLVSIKSVLSWRIKNRNYSQYNQGQNEDWLHQERDVSKQIPCLETLLKADCELHENKLDLNATYTPHSFFCFLQGLIQGAVVDKTEHALKVSTNSLKSKEIYDIIKDEWDAFVKGPWLRKMTGLLANFKYYCESEERPRFYSLGTERSYGFRLRTRDHSWIVGQLFMPTSTEEALPGKLEILETANRGYILRQGKLFVLIRGEEKIAH